MKKSYLLIAVLAVIKLVIQLLGNRNYGFHRDELLHLSVSEHLDWGFMEFPPFIGLAGKLSYLFFDYSLMGTRFFPTLAGVAILVLCCLMAREFKGSFKAMLLAGVCVLAFLPFYRNHTLFQPVAFDQLFWTLGFYFWIRFINTEDKNYLLLTGLTLGAGLMNKYTIIIWAFGIFSGILLSDQKSLLKDKWLYLSGLLALAIFLPNIIWQLENGVPFIRHLQELSSSQLDEISWYDFGLQQLAFPVTLIISIIGVNALIRGKTYRSVGVAAIIIFITMWALKSKAYYVFALYPVLFAAGSAKVEAMLSARNPIWIYTSSAILFLSIVPFIPHLTPVLPIDQFIKYADINAEAGRYELTGDYADMFGWEEQAALVDSVYGALSDEERANCVLWAENYGEAGALKILGRKYGLPNPISRHGSFWSWGHGNANASVWISLGNEQDAVEWIFNDVELVTTITHPYAIGEENGIPLYVCRTPKRDVAQWWKDYEPYIFD
ncbi:MAG: glycosyltransferase family 39 protein [Calditrichia bacterium]